MQYKDFTVNCKGIPCVAYKRSFPLLLLTYVSFLYFFERKYKAKVQIRIHIVGARIYQTIISKVLNISD